MIDFSFCLSYCYVKYIKEFNINSPRNRFVLFAILIISLSGCAGTIIETATDTALAVAKVPFKAGGAIIDVLDSEEDD